MFEYARVSIPEWILHHWWIYAYKIPPPLQGSFQDFVKISPDERFEQVVGGYVMAALRQEFDAIPYEVQPAILNLANDLVSGREMVIRTGDYIAIQRHLREKLA